MHRLMLLSRSLLWLSIVALLGAGLVALNTFDRPFTISKGGTYTGTYRSTDSARPCVRITTTEPVILLNCTFSGPGNLIEAKAGQASVTVLNCQGYGLVPTLDQEPRGWFLVAEGARQLRVESCAFEHSRGIYAFKWTGDGTPEQTITVRHNRVRNIDGRFRNGGGGIAQFLLVHDVHSLANVEVAWNEVINQPNQSLVEDNLNFYDSSGTPESPIRVHDNYIQGAYPFPATALKYSGTGMTTDGSSASPLIATGYLEAYSNQFVSTCNAAMNIAAGHNIRYHHNRMVTSGLLPDSTRLRALHAATAVFNGANRPAAVFHSNQIDHNVIGYANPDYRQPFPGRHDLSDGYCSTCTTNEHLPNPITLGTERQEWQRWQQKLREQQAAVGVAPVALE
jgi:hypothetical protein